MKRVLLSLALLATAPLALALSPYIHGSRQAAAPAATQLDAVAAKLQAAGFTVIGRHQPKGLKDSGTLIITDSGWLQAVGQVGGAAITAAPLRVGVQADGTVSYINPGYWHRAFVRGKYAQVSAASQAVQQKLAQALGPGQPFGGNVSEGDLANYRYMFGMERFDSDNSLLVEHADFDQALATVRANLGRGASETSKVYEIVMPERKIAVFGVAMNSVDSGEGWWVNKIQGAAHVAALPYEIFIVDNKVYALYARYRIALSWPELGMGEFMRIINAPNAIQSIMNRVATKAGP